MYNFDENAIREAAYFIWKNNGCQANTSISDWDAAINQLASQAAIKLKAPKKASLKVLMPKKKEIKPTSLRVAKSIILKPATASKTKSSAKKTVILKASNTNNKSKKTK